MMKRGWLVFYVLHWVLATWISFPAFSQEEDNEPDSTIIVDDTLQVGQEGIIGTGRPGVETAPDTAIIEKVSRGHIPRKAALFSAALPGLGQIYNGKYWKVPIIYAGFATLGYFVVWNNDKYQLFRRAKIALESNSPEESPFQGINPSLLGRRDILDRGVEQYRRDRDFTIILIAGLYGLQIMDAIVDAHLIEFEVNEELTLQLHPSAGGYDTYHTNMPSYGLALTLSIK